MTKQINVHRSGTFENNIASILSEDLKAIAKKGFGPLESILRHALFNENNSIDWEAVGKDLMKQYPERVANIHNIFVNRGTHWKEG